MIISNTVFFLHNIDLKLVVNTTDMVQCDKDNNFDVFLLDRDHINWGEQSLSCILCWPMRSCRPVPGPTGSCLDSQLQILLLDADLASPVLWCTLEVYFSSVCLSTKQTAYQKLNRPQGRCRIKVTYFANCSVQFSQM